MTLLISGFIQAAEENKWVSVDSVMLSFRKRFNADFPTLFNNSFGGPVWNDSLCYYDFMKQDYFMEKYRNKYFNMEEMMRSMDSNTNQFLEQHYLGLRRKVD